MNARYRLDREAPQEPKPTAVFLVAWHASEGAGLTSETATAGSNFTSPSHPALALTAFALALAAAGATTTLRLVGAGGASLLGIGINWRAALCRVRRRRRLLIDCIGLGVGGVSLSGLRVGVRR